MSLVLRIKTFKAVGNTPAWTLNLNTTGITQAEPLSDYDEAIDREFTLSDGRKFDADGSAPSAMRPGMTTAIFKVTAANPFALNQSLASLKAREGYWGVLVGEAPVPDNNGAATAIDLTCNARLKSVRVMGNVKRPFVYNKKQVAFVEMVWSKASVWSGGGI